MEPVAKSQNLKALVIGATGATGRVILFVCPIN